MKKLLMIAGALLFCAWNAHSEVVETVGYNPTRYGQFKRLKVSSGTEMPGGVVAPQAQAGGSLTLNACQDGCANPAYKIDRLQASYVVQGTNTAFEVEKVTANSGSVTLRSGGEISSAVGTGKVAVGQLDAKNSNLVVGNSLKLGKGTIVAPSDRTDCQWVWENVAHKDGTAKVLALKGCAGGTDPANPEEPVATCAQRDYLIAHKAECCPSEDHSNTDCWTPKTGSWKYDSENLVTGISTIREINRKRVECTEPYIHRDACPVDDIGAYTTLFYRYGSWDHKRGAYPDCTEFNSTCTVKVYCWDGVPSTRMDITYVCDSWYEQNGW